MYGRTLRQAVWLVDLSGDSTVPTWYASVTLLLCAVLLAVTAAAYKRAEGRAAWHWGCLSVLFLGLSVDEVATIHEWTGNLLGPTHGVLYYSWIVFGLAFAGGLGVLYLPFVLRLPPRLRGLVVLAGGLFVGGALGVEMVNSWLGYAHPERHLTYMLTTALEEGLEKAGVLVFVYALLDHLRLLGVGLAVEFRPGIVADVRPETHAHRSVSSLAAH